MHDYQCKLSFRWGSSELKSKEALKADIERERMQRELELSKNPEVIPKTTFYSNFSVIEHIPVKDSPNFCNILHVCCYLWNAKWVSRDQNGVSSACP
jgi:hypothetical protein